MDVAGVLARPRSMAAIQEWVEGLAPVGLVTIVGLIARAWPLLFTDFPSNDGGMFAAMIADIRHAGVLPLYTSYNGGTIPFAYPPLALLVSAALPADAVTLERVIPAVAATLTVPVMYLLAREVTGSRNHAFFAALFFALVPRAFDWLVVGGGLTRAPGFLMSLIGIYLLWRIQHETTARLVLGAGIAFGLAALTHPEAALCALLTWAVVFARSLRSPARTRILAVAVVATAIILPWLALVIARYGIGPLLGAAATGGNASTIAVTVISPTLTDEVVTPVFLMLAILGLATALSQRRFVLPVWAALLLADSRGAPTYSMVPLAILAAVGFLDGLSEGVMHVRLDPRRLPDARASKVAFAAVVLALSVSGGGAGITLHALTLTAAERDAMRWIDTHTPYSARITVLANAGLTSWMMTPQAEWLPYLAHRNSPSTPQGTEWSGGGVWQERVDDFDQLRHCVDADVQCIANWMDAHNTAWLMVARGNSVGAVASSSLFDVEFSGPGVLVAKLRGAAMHEPRHE